MCHSQDVRTRTDENGQFRNVLIEMPHGSRELMEYDDTHNRRMIHWTVPVAACWDTRILYFFFKSHYIWIKSKNSNLQFGAGLTSWSGQQ
jgi:hypothetical protein